MDDDMVPIGEVIDELFDEILLKDHDVESFDCWCNPRVQLDPGCIVILHRRFPDEERPAP